MRLTGRTNSVASTRDNTPGQTRARQFRLCAPALSRSKRYALSATTFCIRSPASGKGWRATENNRPISSGVCPACGHADDLPSLNHLRRCKTSHKRAIPHPLSGALASLPGSFLSGRAGWMKIEKMPRSRERLLPKRARLDALSSKFLPLLSPSGQSPLKGTPRKLCHRSSLAFPALWPVHRRPCRPPPPIEAARTSQSLPSPSGQSPPKGTPRKLCHRSNLAFPALWPVHRRPCRAARFPGAPDGRKLKRCHALGSVFFPGAPGWMPFQASSSLCCPHSDNRRPKEHRENFATKQPRIPRPLASTLASLPGAAPYRSDTHLPEPTVPIRTIATQRDTAKTLPQGSLASSRPLAGTSASLSGAAPYRSGTHLPEPAAPNLTIAAHGTRGKLPQSVVRCFRVYQISGRALQIFQAYL